MTVVTAVTVAEMAAEMARFKGEMSCAMSDAVRRAAEAGVVDPTRVEACSTACRGLITISVMDFLYKNGDLGPGLAGRLVGDLLRGFGMEAPGRGS